MAEAEAEAETFRFEVIFIDQDYSPYETEKIQDILLSSDLIIDCCLGTHEHEFFNETSLLVTTDFMTIRSLEFENSNKVIASFRKGISEIPTIPHFKRQVRFLFFHIGNDHLLTVINCFVSFLLSLTRFMNH